MSADAAPVQSSAAADGSYRGADGYLPTLDGWRAVAITAVLLSHGHTSFFLPAGAPAWAHAVASEGRLGVDLFFALSGFLICSRLLAERTATGRIHLGRFYARRAWRILPPYLVYLLVLALLAVTVGLPVAGWEFGGCLLFVRNYLWGDGLGGVYTNHFWSLAVEEHFYLLWPLLLAWAGARRAGWAALELALAVHVWRAVDSRLGLFARVWPDAGPLARTDTRLDALLWGCLAALAFPALARTLRARASFGWAWVAVLLLIVGAVAGRAPMLPLWLAVLFPALLVATVVHAGHPSVRWLEWAPLRWLGRLSYSLYIWQTLFLQTDDPASRGRFPLEPLQRFPLNLPAALLCAVGSFYLVERPALRLGRRLLARRRGPSPRPAGETRVFSSRGGQPLA